ncbi:Uncharacterised protein [Vibrio cholerae]|nr:Uncharacterised protein [Vibrio cholerae]
MRFRCGIDNRGFHPVFHNVYHCHHKIRGFGNDRLTRFKIELNSVTLSKRFQCCAQFLNIVTWPSKEDAPT